MFRSGAFWLLELIRTRSWRCGAQCHGPACRPSGLTLSPVFFTALSCFASSHSYVTGPVSTRAYVHVHQVFSRPVQLLSPAQSKGQPGPLCRMPHPQRRTEKGQNNICVLLYHYDLSTNCNPFWVSGWIINPVLCCPSRCCMWWSCCRTRKKAEPASQPCQSSCSHTLCLASVFRMSATAACATRRSSRQTRRARVWLQVGFTFYTRYHYYLIKRWAGLTLNYHGSNFCLCFIKTCSSLYL